jgi:hypothetical protein
MAFEMNLNIEDKIIDEFLNSEKTKAILKAINFDETIP